MREGPACQLSCPDPEILSVVMKINGVAPISVDSADGPGVSGPARKEVPILCGRNVGNAHRLPHLELRHVIGPSITQTGNSIGVA